MFASILFVTVLIESLISSQSYIVNTRLAPHKLRLNRHPCTTAETITPEVSDAFSELKTQLRGTCLYLVGMMGTGKTSVGNELSQKLGYRFLDTDDLAEYMIEMPIADFFAQGREAEFRQIEYQVLMELSQYTRLVVSTGGGIVMKNENWGLLRHGIVVHLDLPVEDIYHRLSSNPEQLAKRPLLQQQDPLKKLQEISESRQDKYSMADVIVPLSKEMNNEQVAQHIATSILSFIATNPPKWVEWKKKRESIAVETAARFNPSAVDKADVGFEKAEKMGSVRTINLSDIKSGKVKIGDESTYPPLEGEVNNNENGEEKPFKGFKR